MKGIAQGVIVFLLLELSVTSAFAARFIDLSGNWAERAINNLSDNGVIPAEPDGRFQADRPVTRAVFATWLVRALGLRCTQEELRPCRDVRESDWFYEPVAIVTSRGYMPAFADGFRPHKELTKSQAVEASARMLGVTRLDHSAIAGELAKYKDGKEIPGWAAGETARLSKAGLLVNYPDPQTVNIEGIVTRAEAAAMLSRLQAYQTRLEIAHATQQAMRRNQAELAIARDTDSSSRGGAGVSGFTYDGSPQAEAPPGQHPAIGNTSGVAVVPRKAEAAPFPDEAPPGAYLKGSVTVIAAGTHFRVILSNTLDSAYNQPGDEFRATVAEPVYSNGRQVLPAGSRLIGRVTDVETAKSLRFGKDARIDVTFTAIESTDGRRIPLSASVDVRRLKAAAGVTETRTGKAARSTGRGAVRGLKWGAGAGAIYGAASGGTWNSTLKGAGVGALVGTGLGGVGGLIGAGARKGSEVVVPAGCVVPVKLDAPLSLDLAPVSPATQPSYGSGNFQQTRQSGSPTYRGTAEPGYPGNYSLNSPQPGFSSWQGY